MEEEVKKEVRKKNSAFGLPTGTIRSLLAIFIILTCCYCVVFKVPLPDWFIAIGGQIITFYFLMPRKG